MNISNWISWFTRKIARKMVNRGINAGIDYAARPRDGDDPLSEQDKDGARNAKETARKAKKFIRLLRRLGRF